MPGLVKLIVDRSQRQLDAERRACKDATPAAEPFAEEVAVLEDVETADGGSEFFGVACVGCGDGLIKEVLVVEEMAEGYSRGLKFCDEVGYGNLIDAADPTAHEAITNGADPVAEEMTVWA